MRIMMIAMETSSCLTSYHTYVYYHKNSNF